MYMLAIKISKKYLYAITTCKDIKETYTLALYLVLLYLVVILITVVCVQFTYSTMARIL